MPQNNGKNKAALSKTSMCMFFGKGKCAKGMDCVWAHDTSELRAAPDLRQTRLCRKFRKGCCDDPTCRFAHGKEELRSSNSTSFPKSLPTLAVLRPPPGLETSGKSSYVPMSVGANATLVLALALPEENWSTTYDHDEDSTCSGQSDPPDVRSLEQIPSLEQNPNRLSPSKLEAAIMDSLSAGGAIRFQL
eukprot:CAMPEP_0197631278 /NCGR_PEP_ID=MMETSP1338-20131121/8497_1 /TAXON_ID=43686 ORGANISM="Pelagodinium beii, Strain RCC1491" /NCGR_SAMPLE_ID=MMETSP1338 /ASSEMBLY_ACC=CAM_ASM_000754 /LENGTH=189 /DNA_ID=CAMNT_0043202695 /DNA_START=67 /DNA_END=636 /DNA_ORIENTATION=-